MILSVVIIMDADEVVPVSLACRLRQRGYRDGRHGLVLSLLMAFYRLLSQIKLWERHLWSSRPVQAEYDAIRRELLEMHRRERLAGSGKDG